jgi:exportin-1
MEALLNFSNGIDVNLLDQVVAILQQAAHADRAKADAILRQLKENDQAWQFVDKILEQSSSPHTKYFALQILDDAINTRWKVLPNEQRMGIKDFVVKKVIELSQDDTKYAQESLFVNRLNLSLVNILKQEWPHNWPNFVQDLVVSGSQSESLCENNMRILKLLSEEVFDFSKEQMTTQKVLVWFFGHNEICVCTSIFFLIHTCVHPVACMHNLL